MAMIIAY